MTVNGFWTFLREKYPSVFIQILVSQFAGKRISIDTGSWFTALRIRARRAVLKKMATDAIRNDPDEQEVDSHWIQYIVEDVMMLLSNDITPILIFEGRAPAAKDATKGKRIEKTNKSKAEITKLRSQLSSDILRVDRKMLSVLIKKISQIPIVPDESKSYAMRLFNDMRIPSVKTLEGQEAERLACALVNAGIAAAVISEDSDCLAHLKHGILLRGFPEWAGERTTFDAVRKSSVVNELGLTHEGFMDLCILSGCDYNSNIRNVGIGSIYKLLKDYGHAEYFPQSFHTKHHDKLPMLNYHECVELFRPCEYWELFDVETFATNIGKSVGIDLLEEDIFNINTNLDIAWQVVAHYNLAKGDELIMLLGKVSPPENYFSPITTVVYDSDLGANITTTTGEEIPSISSTVSVPYSDIVHVDFSKLF